MEPTDIALPGLRLWLGAVMVAHGINHGRNVGGTASWFASKGFRYSRMNALVSWAGEAVIGFGLILEVVQLPVFWRRPTSQSHTTNRETESAS